MSVRIDDPDASRQARGGGPRLGLLVVVALVVAAVLAWSFVPTGDRSEESSDPVRGTRAAPEAGEMAQGTAETGTGGATRQVAGVPRGFPQTVDGAVQSYVASLGLFTAGMATLSAEQLQAFVRDFTLTDTSYARVQADKRAMLGLDESGVVIDARPGDAVVASCPAALGAYRTSDVTPTSGAPTSVAVGYWGPCVYGVGSAENRDRLSIVWQQTTATMTWRDGDWRLDTTRPGSAEQAPVPVDLNRPETSFGQRADLLGDGWELFDGADESWPTTLLGAGAVTRLVRGRGPIMLLLAVALAVGVLLPGWSASASDGTGPTPAPTDPACATNPVACTVGTTPREQGSPATGSVDAATEGIASPTVETERTLAAIDEYTPESAVDSWAQAAAEGAVSVLGQVSTWQDRVTTPAFDRAWWRDQYAVMFGLSLMVFAFLLVVVVARIGGTDGSVSAAQLLRDSGLRLWLVPALLAVAPVVLSLVQGTAAELARAFARQSSGTGDATTQFLERMTAVSAGFDSFGGSILALLVLLGILVFSLLLLVEVAVASWGLNILGLVVPLAVVMHLYPPWRRPLSRLVGLMLGLMLTPVAVSFVYWTFFSATDRLADGLDLFGTSLFLLVGTMLLCAAPLLLTYLLPAFVPAAAPAPAASSTRTVADGPVGGTPRVVARLSDHFRTKEMVPRPAATTDARQVAEGARGRPGDPVAERRRATSGGPRRAAAAALPERETRPDSEAEAVQAHEEVAAQLGGKHASELFDPEPFDAPRPTEEAREDGWWHR